MATPQAFSRVLDYIRYAPMQRAQRKIFNDYKRAEIQGNAILRQAEQAMYRAARSRRGSAPWQSWKL